MATNKGWPDSDRSRLAEQVAGHAPQLLRDARQLFRVRAHDAADVTQSAVLTALVKLDTFDSRRPLLPWLRGILRIHAARHFQRLGQRRVLVADAVEAVEFDEPADAAHRKAVLGALQTATDSLDAPYGEVVRRHLLESESPARIAEQLDRSTSTVRTQLQRGLTKLRASLPPALRNALAVLIAVRSADAAHTPPSEPATTIRRGRRALLASLCVLGVSGAAWWTLRTPSLPPVSSAERTAAQTKPPSTDAPSAPRRAPAPAADSPAQATTRAGAASIVVLDPLGQPVPGLSVRLNPNHRTAGSFVHVGLGHWHTEKTNGEGRAQFDGLPAGSYSVHLDDGKGLPELLQIPAGRSAERTIRAAGVRLVTGRVVDATDRGVEGAVLHCASNATITPGWVAARSTRDGRFEFPWVRTEERGAYVFATAEGHAASRPTELRFRGGEVTLRLQQPDCSVRGQVRCEPANTPPRDVLVALIYADTNAGMPRYQKVAADGTFAFEGCPPGSASLMAAAPGRSPTTRSVVIAPDSSGDHTLELGPGATVAGTVSGIHGIRTSSLRIAVLPKGTGPANMHALAAWARVDEDGRFKCPCASGSVVAHLVDGGPIASQAFELQAGERQLWDPAMPPGPVISGRVLTAQPSLVRVGYRTEAPGTTLDARETLTVPVAADGSFDLPVPLARASYRLLAFWRGVGPGATPCAERAGVAAGQGIELPIPSGRGPAVRVTGRLVQPDGTPWRGRAPQIHDDRHQIYQEGHIAADGTFAFSAVTAGEHWLSLPDDHEDPGALLRRLNVPAGAGTMPLGEVRIPRRVRTRLHFARPVAPPANWRLDNFRAVLHERESRLRAWFPPTARGTPTTLEIDLVPGRYELAIQGRNVQESRVPVDVPSGVTDHEQTIRLQAAAQCLVVFRYRAPTRTSRATRIALTIHAVDTSSGAITKTEPLHRLVGIAGPNQRHAAAIGLQPGRYELAAKGFWGATGKRTITVEDTAAVQQFDLPLR